MGQWLIADLSRLGCSLPALDAVSHRHYIALVCLRLGDAVAFAESLKPARRIQHHVVTAWHLINAPPFDRAFAIARSNGSLA